MGRPYQFIRETISPFSKGISPGLVAALLRSGGDVTADRTGLLHPNVVDVAPMPVGLDPRLFATVGYELVIMQPPALPRMYIIDPVIDSRSFPHLNHLYLPKEDRDPARAHPLHHVDPRYPREDICYFAPHDDVWRLERDPLYRLVDFAASWVACFLLTQYGEVDEWPVQGAPHGNAAFREALSARLCPCTSGRSFERCHRGRHGSSEKHARLHLRRIGAL